ncbi:EcoAI/FtnUII family type I restriction enzme subunit R [Burkholderia diffusa]|uniref:EcoAI/FtnUII family type I restriction enzme subunit R n=1 Tax=Burkholderia diffusa TaxID=488732 RepID=UPI0008419212|nr:DEAD/DEAH box helicase [Burkholderia diffusa]
MGGRSVALTEADTCREYVTPALQKAGWGDAPYAIGEQRPITDGRILLIGGKARRAKVRKPDYILYYRRDFPIAVVEAKETGLPAENGVQQAREYAQIMNLRFAYATNGLCIIEIDYTNGTEREVERYPTPEELWARLSQSAELTATAQQTLLEPYNLVSGKKPRYYQDATIRSVVEAVLSGKKRVLATLATGTGKTSVAFQVCWKLWNSRWNRNGEYRRPKILFLADRNILVDDPKDKDFIHFGDARHKISSGDASQARDMYFGIYQALTTANEDVFRQYRPEFFDLIIIDECHRGAARDESSWRRVLDYFSEAVHFGMTATPLRDETRDTYEYFGNPVYLYSLKQGIEDGFLAPYRVHRIITSADAAGWRPSRDEVDRYGRTIPDDEYQTKDFERVVALRARTKAIAKHLTGFMQGSDRFAKTIVFCVDQEHASEMRQELVNLNADLVKEYSDYVCRVTSDEGDIGLAHLAHFQDLDKPTPAIVTSSQMLTTGVDAATVKNVVLARVVGSQSEFKQIIGRGTRLRVDYGKEFFNIIDYTGTATQHFADPDFDGFPVLVEEQSVDADGTVTATESSEPQQTDIPPVDSADGESEAGEGGEIGGDDEPTEPRKYYVDGGEVEVIGHLVFDLDADGKKLQVVRYTEYTARSVRSLFPTRGELESAWAKPDTRAAVLHELAERHINFDELVAAAGQPDADPLDLLCHLAWNAPLLTRRERAERVRRLHPDLFAQYGDIAREILGLVIERYIERGLAKFEKPSELLTVEPFDRFGRPSEIAAYFGGPKALRAAFGRLQSALYQ